MILCAREEAALNENSENQSKSPARSGPRLGGMFDPLARGMTAAAGISLFVMMVMMTIHIVGRKIGQPVPGAFEASEQLMVIVFAFPLAEVGLRKAHIIFELISRALPKRTQARLEIFQHIVGLLLFGPLTWKAWQIAWNNFLIREYRQGIIDFPIWPFRVALAIGLSVFLLQLVLSLIRSIKQEEP